MPAYNKNYMSIGVSVRTIKPAARDKSIGVRQETTTQSANIHTIDRFKTPNLQLNK